MVDEIKKRGKTFIDEFKGFAFKEATLGAAVGIMLGATLKDMINSLVNDILTPPIGYLTSGIDFTDLFFVLGKESYTDIEQAREAGAVVITYGNFINEFISFVITALVLFLIFYQGTKIVGRFNRKEEVRKEKKEKVCKYCRSKIPIKATRCPQCTSQL